MTDLRIEEYIPVFEFDFEEFRKKIDYLISQGFQPHGSMGLERSDNHPRYTFTQAMVLYEEKESV